MGDMADDYEHQQWSESQPYSEWNPRGYKEKPMTKDTVNIHGKEYETVASRVQRFREKYGNNMAIITELISSDDKLVVMKAYIKEVDEIGKILATGYAEESRTSSSINRTSALENCETSAIGRALAAFGMAGTEYASADEVAHAVIRQSTQAAPSAKDFPATDRQKKLINDKLSQAGIADEDKKGYLAEQYGITDTSKMTAKDASAVIEQLILAN